MANRLDPQYNAVNRLPKQEGFLKRAYNKLADTGEAIAEATGLKGMAKAVAGGVSATEANIREGARGTDFTKEQNRLVNEANKHPRGSRERQLLLTKASRIAGQATQYSESLGQDLEEAPTKTQALASTGKALLTAATLGSGGLSGGLPGVSTVGLSKAGLLGTGARMLEGAGIGAGLNTVQQLEQGESPKEGLALSTILGAALPATFEGGVWFLKKLTQNLPSGLINRDIKPLLKHVKYGQDPGEGVVREGLVANNLDELGSQLDDRVRIRGQEIGALYSGHADKIDDYSDALKILDDKIDELKATKPRGAQALIKRFEDAKKDLLRFEEVTDEVGNVIGEQATRKLGALTPEEGFLLKRDVSDATQFAGTPTDDNIFNSTLHRVYGKIRDKLHKNVPGLAQADEHFSNIKSAQLATKYRNDIEMRQSLFSLVTRLGGIGSVVYGVATGDVKNASIALAVDLLAAAMGSTAARTRVAYLLNKMSPGEKAELLRQIPLIQRLIGE